MLMRYEACRTITTTGGKSHGRIRAGAGPGHHVLAGDRVRRHLPHPRHRPARVQAAFPALGLGGARSRRPLVDGGRDPAHGTRATRSLSASDIAAIGITNQRETTLVWERATGKAIHNAIVWQDRRTADICAALKADGSEALITERTGLIADSYFSATKVAWILDHVEGARARAEAGDLAFGTVDSWLLWHLTGGRRHVTDATNASRTMLCNIDTGQWDDDLLRLLRVPRAMLPEILDCIDDFGTTDAGAVRGRDPDPGRGGGPAGGDRRPGLLPARHDEIDLRHGLLRAPQHRT